VNSDSLTVSAFGEKRLIAEFVRPLFNSANAVNGVGDDCAMIDIGENLILASTDRVPADLIAFRLGILNYHGLGRYLACLNLSDIAACGGTPAGLLLNMGLPSELLYSDFKAICYGFAEMADLARCPVLGGDITQAVELSISATSIGRVNKHRVLTRRSALPGDTIFLSKEPGLTPAAFAFYRNRKRAPWSLTDIDTEHLNRQFTHVIPMIDLGLALAEKAVCTACMDNTDGIGQSLTELSRESEAAFVVDSENVVFPDVVHKVARAVEQDTFELGLSGGADFSLVGTLHGEWTTETATRAVGFPLSVIGRVEEGTGVFVKQREMRKPLSCGGWDYFSTVPNL
jgi:thiamine-monophosphate kinase